MESYQSIINSYKNNNNLQQMKQHKKNFFNSKTALFQGGALLGKLRQFCSISKVKIYLIFKIENFY